MSPCEDFIIESVWRLTESPAFTTWLSSESANAGDLILINNSFVFRDVKTTKADAFLSFRMSDDGTDPDIVVSRGVRFNVDFKRMAASSQNLPPSQALTEAIQSQIRELGHLVFLLIGEVDDTEWIATEIGHAAFNEVVWDPTMADDCRVEADRIVVKRTDDEELVWTALLAHYQEAGEPEPDGLREAFGVALDKLQDSAVAQVRVPGWQNLRLRDHGCSTDRAWRATRRILFSRRHVRTGRRAGIVSLERHPTHRVQFLK